LCLSYRWAGPGATREPPSPQVSPYADLISRPGSPGPYQDEGLAHLGRQRTRRSMTYLADTKVRPGIAMIRVDQPTA